MLLLVLTLVLSWLVRSLSQGLRAIYLLLFATVQEVKEKLSAPTMSGEIAAVAKTWLTEPKYIASFKLTSDVFKVCV